MAAVDKIDKLGQIEGLEFSDCIAFFDAKATDRDRTIMQLAHDQMGSEGEVEVDNAIISEGDDNGAYVLAWVWADFAGTPLDKEKDE